MDFFSHIIFGFQTALTPWNVFFCLIGTIIGTAVGVLPGLGPTATLALLLPITYRLDATASVIMLAGIYYGSMYGGSITSILVNIPGEAASIVTCLDGYQMAHKGRAGAALGMAAFGSFIAGTLSVCGLMLFAPRLARFGLKFGPPEFFMAVLLGLTFVTYITSESTLKSLIMAVIGLILSCVCLDPIYGTERFIYGVQVLSDGFDVAVLGMGLFGIAEVLTMAERPIKKVDVMSADTSLRKLLPSREEWRRSIGPIGRGTVLGFFIGLLPGGGAVISSFASYLMEKKLSRHPEEFGRGAIEGVAGPEAANNAASQGTFVPLLTLGIPSNATSAILLGAIILHGMTPGPLLIRDAPNLFWGLICSMYVGNVLLVILNVPLIRIFVAILKVPYSILSSLIIMFCFIGAYSINNQVSDILLLSIFGGMGYLFRRLDLSCAPLLLGFVLGPIFEKAFRQSLVMGRGNPLIFISRPISAGIFIFWIFVLLYPLFLNQFKKFSKATR
jgi:putative tricarboxylic transport membrane protein